MRIAVIGATGRVGLRLMDAAEAAGTEVVGISGASGFELTRSAPAGPDPLARALAGCDALISRHTDLPVTERGLIVVRPDLRVGTAEHPVPDAWAAGDDAAVPDVVTSPVPPYTAFTVPNAQHAVRQGKLLAGNLIRTLRGREPRPYRHHSLGSVATLGLGIGVFQAGPIVVKGLPAWLMHRGYHLLAVPTWERKVRVGLTWAAALPFGRDIISLESVQHPNYGFTHAGRPWSRDPRPLTVVRRDAETEEDTDAPAVARS